MIFFIIAIYVVGLVSVAYLVEREAHGFVVLDLVFSLGLLHWLGAINLGATGAAIAANPASMLFFAGAYLAVAALWACFKWYRLARPMGLEYKKEREAFAVKHGLDYQEVGLLHTRKSTEDGYALSKTWAQVLSRRRCWVLEDDNGKASLDTGAYYDKLIGWMLWWPVSVFNYFVADLLADLCERMFNALKGAFKKISESQFN